MSHLFAVGVLATFLAACAGNGTAIPQEREIGRDRSEILRQRLDTTGVAVVLARDPAAVWAALPAAYGAVGLSQVEVDGSASRVGVRNLRVRGRLGGTQLSEFVDCGSSRPGLLNADQYEIRMNVLTGFEAAGKRTVKLWTIVFAEAYDQLSGSSQTVLCYSTGELEAKLHEELDRRGK